MKRAQEDQGVDDPSKRPRTDGTPQPGSAAPGKPSLSLDALEKAKKALQLQKDLKEKLKKLPQVCVSSVWHRGCTGG
jgi:U4/U6 small nuclear ribonucleoprotein PRP3